MSCHACSIVLAATCLSLASAASAALAQLPEGEGREIVNAFCVSCHDTGPILRSSGYTAAEWSALIHTMIELPADGAQRRALVDYLATYLPPHDGRAPRLVDGDVQLTFERWVVPTLGQRSRDPVEAPDGGIWWAGQWGNLIGRIDPETGAMQEYPLPPMAMPHSVNADRHGNIWYTGNRNGTIGRLDPGTGEIREYPMPDPAARDPHTAEFDADGTLWFTLQQSNRIGRLDPATGKVDLVTLARPNSRPYGIKIDAQGTPWVACNGGNCLVRVNPETMETSEITLPLAETTVRRLDIARDGMIWYVNSGAGRLGRYDPYTGAVREWPSPSGPDSHPYALAVVNGIVWYNESGKRPDALVRFDPASETFQSWPIPSGNVYAGIVRHMRPARDGSLLIHQSATNHILRVRVEETVPVNADSGR